MAYPSNTSDLVAQDQIKAFVERIMRMREEAKAINDDIREIYAEAKGNGFDKTVLGKIVLYVEKRDKNADAILEAQALFDLYLDAFDGATGTVVATHTHEKLGLAAPALSGDDRQANTKAAPIQSDDPTEPAGDSPNTVASRPNSEPVDTHRRNSAGIRKPDVCQHVERCAVMGWRQPCHECQQAHADEMGFTP